MEMDNKIDGVLSSASLNITDEILKLISDIDEFKGVWKAIGRMASCAARR